MDDAFDLVEGAASASARFRGVSSGGPRDRSASRKESVLAANTSASGASARSTLPTHDENGRQTASSHTATHGATRGSGRGGASGAVAVPVPDEDDESEDGDYGLYERRLDVEAGWWSVVANGESGRRQG